MPPSSKQFGKLYFSMKEKLIVIIDEGYSPPPLVMKNSAQYFEGINNRYTKD